MKFLTVLSIYSSITIFVSIDAAQAQAPAVTLSPGRTCENVDVIAVITGSSTVGQANYDIIIDHVANTTMALFTSLGHRFQFGVVEYAEKELAFQQVKVNESNKFNILELGACSSISCVNGSLQSVTYLNKNANNFGYGLERAMDVEFQKSSRYPNASKLIVLFTDGAADDSEVLAERYQKSQENKIMIFAVGISDRVNVTELQIVANGGGSNQNVFAVNDFETLPSYMDISNDIVDIVCTDHTTAPVMTTTPNNATQGTSNTTDAMSAVTGSGKRPMTSIIWMLLALMIMRFVIC